MGYVTITRKWGGKMGYEIPGVRYGMKYGIPGAWYI